MPLGISKYQPPPPRYFKPQFALILGVYMVVGGAPNPHAIRNFGLDLKWLFDSSTSLMYLGKKNDN